MSSSRTREVLRLLCLAPPRVVVLGLKRIRLSISSHSLLQRLGFGSGNLLFLLTDEFIVLCLRSLDIICF
jgi:hypothetical protein